MRRPLTSFLLPSCLFCFLRASSSDGVRAQQTPGPVPTLQATSRLVFVDVIARDKHGKAIEGLTQDDFQVSEHLKASGNAPQKISFFREVDISRDSPSTSAKQQLVSTPVSSSENTPPVTILLLDALNTNPSGQREVIHRLGAMIDAIPPGSPAALFMLGGQLMVLQSLTSNHALLKQAAERTFPPHAIAFSSLAGQSLGVDATRRYTDPDFATYAAKATSAGLREIAKQMIGIPGRKNLVWVSDSFPSTVIVRGNFTESFVSSAIQPAIEALSTARVAVYSVLASPVEPARQGVENNDPGRIQPVPAPVVTDYGHGFISDDLMRAMRQATMQVISDQTGGIACTNVSDLRGCVAKAMDHGSRYYEIAYYPSSNAPGVHGIVVRTERPGVTLTYPQSYDTGSGPTQP